MALVLTYKVRSYSTGTLGRAICNARTHHFVADDPGKDEVGAGELFLSGISACAVNMVERLANHGRFKEVQRGQARLIRAFCLP